MPLAQRAHTALVRPAGSSGERPGYARAARAFARGFASPFTASARLTDAAVVYRRLSLLLRAGIAPSQALRSMAETTEDSRLRAALDSAAASAADGRAPSGPLSALPFAGPADRAMLAAAEQTGSLPEMLDRIAEYREGELRLRRFISRWTLYAKITLVAGLLVIPAAFSFVMGGNPLAVLLGFLRQLLTLVLAAGIASGTVAALSETTPRFRRAIELLQWSTPLIKDVSRGSAAARFCRAFGALYDAGLPPAAALRTAAGASGSALLEEAAEDAALAVEQGFAASAGFKAAGVLPADTLELLRTGEVTGRVGESMRRAAERIEEDVEARAYKIAFGACAAVYLVSALYTVAGGR